MQNEKKQLPSVVAYGEVLWDTYQDQRKLGGAPLNVLGHLAQFGVETSIISRIGHDPLGSALRTALLDVGVEDALLQVDDDLPTGEVLVSLDDEGKPSYEIVMPSAWDEIAYEDDGTAAVAKSHLFICGSLAARSPRSRDSLFCYLEHSRQTVVDLNIRLEFYSEDVVRRLLQSANILKLNDEEFELLGDMFSQSQQILYSFLHETMGIDLIIQTRGAHGAEASLRGEWFEHPGYQVKVVDTVGSGDAFLAAFLWHYTQGEAVDVCLDQGCKLGAYVATQAGAIPRHKGRKTST